MKQNMITDVYVSMVSGKLLVIDLDQLGGKWNFRDSTGESFQIGSRWVKKTYVKTGELFRLLYL